MNISQIFEVAIKNKASDIHLVQGLSPIIRVDGKLFSLDGPDSGITSLSFKDNAVISEPVNKDESSFLDAEKYTFSEDGELIQKNGFSKNQYDLKVVDSETLSKVIKEILTFEQLERLRTERDYDFGYQFGLYRFRINLSYERGNLKMVARIISEQQPTLEEIGMPKKVYELLNLKQGLILVTGPTGCGKSTSLAAMINHINNNRNCNIVTLEDPIEFIFKSNKSIITQRQLGTDIPTFASGLKHVLRQDPDVIVVGEMRDLETISTAVTLAETGHLVLATLHTCNSAQTIDRIIDIFPPHQQNQIKSQLALILSAVISQMLIPKKGGGRIAAREILLNNSAVANLIREQKISQIKNVIETHASEGMINFARDIKDLYEKGIISPEDAQDFLSNKIVFD